ncbi:MULTISPECIES: twin-arginine translocase TatA/TatE family subunit [unclassified Mesorhizobium]|uniref:twin-arginine translocase TatA/TatE family subunit n=1 Tax=unclassified Mesorhizobium TaxID=325217 RepID=UPI00333A4FFF
MARNMNGNRAASWWNGPCERFDDRAWRCRSRRSTGSVAKPRRDCRYRRCAREDEPMFGFGIPHLVVIFVVALVVFGPEELPKVMHRQGR